MSEIITAGNPILKAVAAPVTSFDKKLKFLILDMKKTLYEANGVGLAAPQIAVSKRIFVADDGESGFEAYINPEWQPDGDEMATDSEGCLSVPGLFGEVTRYARVIVRYQDIHGKKKVKKASGLLARCIQHETDHLNGILFIEKPFLCTKDQKMKNNYRIVFMGTPDFCLPALSAMVEHGYTPVAAYTQPDKINGRGKKINYSPVKTFAMSHDIPIHQPLSFKDPSEVETLKALKPDLLVVIAYGRILPKAVLDIPTYGAINVHASLLPKYRGAAPIQRVIIDGEKKTGVTIMQLDQGMDTGNIVETVQMDIPLHMTAGELFEALGEMGAKALISVLEDLPEKLARSTPQDHEKATYAEKVTKEMGRIDWTKDAKTLDALIRGMYPNPGTYTFFRGKRVKIHRAEVSDRESKEAPGTIISAKGSLTIACGRGALTISSLQPENHKRMAAGDFVNGYQVKVNDTFDC